MPPDTSSLLGRARTRAGHLSRRLRERVRSLPVRAANRGGIPIPPPRLIYLVSGTEDAAWFLAAGRRGFDALTSILARNGVDPGRLGSVLDFGCGVGRVVRHWAEPAARGVEVHGTDYNPALVAWCRRHLPFARFGVNGLSAGLDYPDGAFDLVYAFSVFTHLTPAGGSAWMAELRRVLRPGGHLVVSLHGEHYLPTLAPADRRRFADGELVVLRGRREGSNDCAAFHPQAFVRGEFSRGWEVVDFVPEGAWGNPSQDLYLLRKPAV